MTPGDGPNDAKKLIAGYATGSLSDAERNRLFEAALEDQELFEELAREQALKELLDEPGAKQRLIAALGSEKPPAVAWWKRPLSWSLAAVAASGIAILTWTVSRTPAPVQVATVAAPTPLPPPAMQQSQPAPPATPRPRKASPKQVSLAPAKKEPEAKKEAAAPQPAATASPAAGIAQGSLVAPRAMNLRRSVAPAVPGIAFDYTIEGQMLNLRFLTAGYLSIHFSPGNQTEPEVRIEAGSSRQESIPDGAMQATIVFTAASGTTSGGVSLNRESTSGRAIDPSATRVELKLQLP